MKPNSTLYMTLKFAASLVIVLLSVSMPAAAQNTRIIQGMVLDEKGAPILGATVAVSGTTQGTSTNVDGRFELKIPQHTKFLNVSFVGYASKRIEIGSAKQLKITLEPDAKQIEDVVVIGYGAVRKSDLTGAVSVLDVKDKTETLPFTSVDQFMQGRIAGVNISQNSGAPGDGMRIQIRGISTLSGDTQPLYVVDGFPIEGASARSSGSIAELSSQPGMNPLASINPNDIESIQVLKDASATAIYGSRATNGVVLITTKQGREGSVRINYNFRGDVSIVSKKYDLLNGYEYALYQNALDRVWDGLDMYGNPNPTERVERHSPEALERYKTIGTDWQDLMYETAFSQDHNISFIGGNKTSQFSISGGYTDQKGIIMNTGLERYTFRMNYLYNINSRLKLTANANYTNLKQSQTSHSQNGSEVQMIRRILTMRPNLTPFDVVYEEDTFEGIVVDNPYTMATKLKDDFLEQTLQANLALNYNIGKGFGAKVAGSLVSVFGQRKTYYPYDTSAGETYNGMAFRGDNKRLNYTFEAQLNYNRTFNKAHRLNGVLVWEYSSRQTDNLQIQAGDFPDDNLSYNNIGQGLTTTNKNSNIMNILLSSFIARFNYSYKDRYIFTVTGRYDGSSLLSEGNQWKFFPSAAIAWNIDQEQFLKSADFISKLRIRGSFGMTGNQNIAYGAPRMIMNQVRTANNGSSPTHGYVPGNPENPDLGWENTKAYNLGLEMGFVKNRYRLNIDIYKRVTSDLLFNFPLPPSSGHGSIPVNMGQISNKGIEIEVGADIISRRKFSWSVGANWYMNRNMVDDIRNNVIEGVTYLSGGSALGQSIHRTMAGYPIGSFYGYVTNGIYQTPEEAAKAPADTPAAVPGSIRYLDISGPDGLPDGKIDSNDRTILGSSQPDFNYGISTDLKWKNLSLSILINGSVGGKIANLNRYLLDAFDDKQTNVRREAWEGRWQGPGTSNFYPALNGAYKDAFFQSRFSTMFLEDATYIRLKNVTLSYAFALKKIPWIKRISVFVTGTNLLTFTDYSGYDPEVSISRSALSPNVDYAAYPSVRTVSFGVNLEF